MQQSQKSQYNGLPQCGITVGCTILLLQMHVGGIELFKQRSGADTKR